MTEIHCTEVDQVKTFWVDAPQPLRAGLLFRTGTIDETAITCGHTHLIEHMSLSAVSEIPKNNNGFVSGVGTGFVTSGGPEEICDFFASLCKALSDLPGDRLESEQKVLAAEGAQRHYNLQADLLTWRYGARGWGLNSLGEIGLRTATIEKLCAYAAQRFTCENAVLWLTGPIPEGLHLQLPHGSKQPLPPLAPLQNDTPGWFLDDASGGVGVGGIVPRSYAYSIFCEIATRRLMKKLRADQAISYAPSTYYEHLDSQVAHLILYADSERSKRGELGKLFGEVYDGLRVIAEDEMVAAREQILENYIGARAPSSEDRKIIEVQRAVQDWIMGDEYVDIDSATKHIQSVTLADVTAFVQEFQKTALFALPSGVHLEPYFGKRLNLAKVQPVQGRKINPIDAPIRKEKLISSLEGVSIVWPKGTPATVRYSDLAAAQKYPDGCVCLIGNDASFIQVEPTLWHDGQVICRKIGERIPAGLLIEEPARRPGAIPKPSTTPWKRFRARVNIFVEETFSFQDPKKAKGKSNRNTKLFAWLYVAFLILLIAILVISVILSR